MINRKSNFTNRIIVVFLAIVGIFTGCGIVPITGRHRLNLVPESIVRSMSLTSYKDFLATNTVSTDTAKTAMVRRVGGKIQKAVENYFRMEGQPEMLNGYEWEFNLVEDDAVNAWAMPGGKVVVYTGLLKVAKTDADLAVVMGHEVAHAIARHGGERMSQQLVFTFGYVALDKALEKEPEKTREIFLTSYGLGGQIGVLLPYSRVHESEADRLGLVFMAMAGYNPETAISFWENMAKQSGGNAPPEFLSTHPAHATRIRNIQEHLAEAMIYYTGPLN